MTTGTALKNTRHETFTQNWFSGMSLQQSAIAAGYSERSARSTSSHLATMPNIKARYQELQASTVDNTIMSVKERRQRLSQFGREDITNDKGTLIRHGNILAIAELSKLGGDYAAQKVDITAGLTDLLGQLRGKAVPQITQGEKGEETEQ